MQTSNNFFLIVLAIVFFTRLWLFLKPISSPIVKGFRLHHYMYGLVLVLVSILSSSIILYGVGFGLIIDELPLVLRYRNNAFGWKEYNSRQTKAGVCICLLLVFLFRKYLSLGF